MTAFDFPASPTPGTVYSAPGGPTYIFDGTAWAVTDPAPAVRIESYDLTGLTQKDLIVPAWGPSMARLTAFGLIPGITSYALRLSLDGTTFPIGGSDYAYGGNVLYSGSSAYATIAWALTTNWPLAAGENTGVPLMATVDVTLTRSSQNQGFSCQIRGSGYHNAVAYGLTTYIYGGALSNIAAAWAGTGPVKALRFITAPSVMVGGKLTVEWLP